MRNLNNFYFTEHQQKRVAEHYGYDWEELEEYKLAELLDMFIDEHAH